MRVFCNRWISMAILTGAIAIGGCTAGRLREFDSLAASPGFQLVPLTGLPIADRGMFRLGTAKGQVAWHAGSDAIGWGPEGVGMAADQVRVGQVARFGVFAFELQGGAQPGHLEARCRYGRTETRHRLFAVDVTVAGRPLRLQCVYRLDGRDAGMMQLAALPASDTLAEPRQGVIRFDGQTLMLRSDHAMEGVRGQTAAPMGYRLAAADGRLAGIIETNGIRSRRLLLPSDPALRPAAIAAALSLALFRDPGDTD